MDQQIVYAVIFLCIFLLLVGISHLLHSWFNVSSENSRKFLHVSGGFLALCSPLFFTSHWWVLVLCSLALLLLFTTYVMHWLPAVHQTRRKSIGSVVYPIPVYICFFVAMYKSNHLLFYLPVSLLTVSDTMAELGGKKWGARSKQLMKKQKTMAGSISFAVSALIISLVWSGAVNLPLRQIALISITITLIATTAEMISTKGWDNITVPLSALLCLLVLLEY